VAGVESAFAWDRDLVELDGVEEEGGDYHEHGLEGGEFQILKNEDEQKDWPVGFRALEVEAEEEDH
jgi:hypothetical protein